MSTGQQAWSLGLMYYQSGNLVQAEQVYRQLAQSEPTNADVWCMLGIVCRAQGKLEDAASSYQQALRSRPNYPEVHNNLGNVLAAQGRLDEAVSSFQEALRLNPQYADPYTNLGAVLRRQGRLDEAAANYRQALRLNPNHANACNNLGEVLAAQGHFEEAVASYQQCLQRNPNHAGAHTNLGVALAGQGKLDEAVAQHRQALALQPQFVDAHINLGNALLALGRLDEAAGCYREALRQQPDSAKAHYNLGIALVDQGKLDEGVASYRQALRYQPDHVEARSNLGHALRAQGKLDEALGCYQEVLRLQPSDPEAHMSQAFAWLLLGDYAQGWREYEWRWQCKEFAHPSYPQPVWDGSPLEGRTILLHAEQGLGDTLQFIRYAPLVKQRGGRVVVQCQPVLLPVLASCAGIDEWVAQGAPLPSFDVHAALLSLPGILGTTLETVPAQVPYLSARPDLVAHWHSELGTLTAFKVGLVWQGNPRHRADRYRSIPLRLFEPLARVPGVQLFSLQKGPEPTALLPASFPLTDLGAQMDDGENGPFMDMAAMIRNLDLVVSVDTAPAHLAGALGVPVWLALHGASDWRWLLNREDSPWYPTMRLFRQQRYGNWEEVIARMVEALRQRLAATPRKGAIRIPVTPGELIDRITRLQIESERVTDAESRAEVRRQLAIREAIRERAIPGSAELTRLMGELREANEAIGRIQAPRLRAGRGVRAAVRRAGTVADAQRGAAGGTAAPDQ